MKINIPLTVTGSITLIALSAKLITSAVSDIQDIKDAADFKSFRETRIRNEIKLQEDELFDNIVEDS